MAAGGEDVNGLLSPGARWLMRGATSIELGSFGCHVGGFLRLNERPDPARGDKSENR